MTKQTNKPPPTILSVGGHLGAQPARLVAVLPQAENNNSVKSMLKKVERHLKHSETEGARETIREVQGFVALTLSEQGAKAIAPEMVALVKAIAVALNIDEKIARKRADGETIPPAMMEAFRREAQDAKDESDRTNAAAARRRRSASARRRAATA